MRDVIINADDYAMDEAVDTAILKLAEAGAVTAASAMALSPRWPESARAARGASSISWGLHLDFTSAFAGEVFQGSAKLPALIVRAHARLLDPAVLRQAIERQLMLFEIHKGSPPDFVDGHQHIHHLPQIRDELLAALAARYGQEAGRIGVRICTARKWRGAKAAIIEATGSSRLAGLAAERGHPMNTDFAGVYDFGAADLASLWQAWAASLQGPLPLIMCHVAAASAERGAGDPIRLARHREFDWLSSAEFRLLCTQSGIHPARWPRA
jgi:hypothetical protein